MRISRSHGIKFLRGVMMLFFAVSICSAQLFDRGSVIGTVGVGFAIAPEQFYDYWGNGIHLGFEHVFPSREPYALSISAGYSFFPFDDERFLKRMGMNGGTTTVEGASSSIINAGMGGYYTFPPYEQIRPFVNAGAHFSYSRRSHSTVHYPFQTVEAESQYKVFLSISVAGGINYPLTERMDVTAGVRRYLGMRREKTVNTDFTTLFTGVQWTL